LNAADSDLLIAVILMVLQQSVARETVTQSSATEQSRLNSGNETGRFQQLTAAFPSSGTDVSRNPESNSSAPVSIASAESDTVDPSRDSLSAWLAQDKTSIEKIATGHNNMFQSYHINLTTLPGSRRRSSPATEQA
jgi:hypothetical protein